MKQIKLSVNIVIPLLSLEAGASNMGPLMITVVMITAAYWSESLLHIFMFPGLNLGSQPANQMSFIVP
jgi:hypothetical protein